MSNGKKQSLGIFKAFINQPVSETVPLRGVGLHEALHGPELPAQARQEPHGRGAAAVPPLQGPGQRRQAKLIPILAILHFDGGGGTASEAAADADAALDGGRPAAGGADADQLGQLALLLVLGDDARRGAAVGRDVRAGGCSGLPLARRRHSGPAVQPHRAAAAAPPAAGEEELGWRQR